MNFEEIIEKFLNNVKEKKIEIYNEFSLQFELGIFLRNEFKEYKVEFERNASFFGISRHTVKHEIDIVVYSEGNDKQEKYAIELKFPRNGQYPEQMYSFVKDIVFMEELKSAGFTNTFVLTIVDDDKFYKGKNITGIYQYFRDGKPIAGTILKPTGKNKGKLPLKIEPPYKTYKINWKNCGDLEYYFLEIL